MKRLIYFGVLAFGLWTGAGMAQNGPLRIEITDGVIEPLIFAVPMFEAENIEAVETCILKHIQQLHTESISSKVLDRVRTQVANRFIFGNERPGDRANLYGYYYSQIGDLEPALTYPDHIQGLTAQDLQTAARTYLSPTAYGRVVALPTAA